MNELILEQESDVQSYGFYAYNVLKTISKELFCKNKALSCLAKSEIFLKDLLNIFNKLYFYNILPQRFLQIVQNLDISDIDKNRLNVCAEVYCNYINIMEANNYKVPLCKGNIIHSIIREADVENDFKNFDNYSCIEFEDVHDECAYILDSIKKLVASGVQYNDIAIFADKLQMRQKILDALKVENIPVKAILYNQEYENLKYKINLFSQMSSILKDLGISEFSSNALKNTSISSRAIREIKFEDLDELVKTILFEIVVDTYSLDKIFIKKDASTKTMLEILFANINIFSEVDKQSINNEFGLFKHFYELYFQNNYFDAIKLLINSKISNFEDAELKKTVLRKLKSLEQLQNLYDDIIHSQPDFSAFIDIMEWLGVDKSKDNAIILESITSEVATQKTFLNVFVVGLTENNFPGVNTAYSFISEDTNQKLSEKLKKEASEFDVFIQTDDDFYSQKLLKIKDVIRCAKEKMFLTTHSYEAKKQVQPSVIFKLACHNTDKYTKINSHITNNSQISDVCFDESNVFKSPIVKNLDVLRLSASAINTFQNCPQKYFYKHLLNLKEPYTFSASYGSIVHAVFEVLNRRFLESNKFTKEIALELGNVLFDSKINPDNAIKAGFKQIDVDLVNESSDLALAEMKDDFVNAIEDFSFSGGFDNPPKSAICEKSFEFSIPELPNIVFDGRIDAILEKDDGTYCIVDYKTGHDKINNLEYAISEYGVNFLLKSGKPPANPEVLQNAYDYQIPLYYLAVQHTKDLAKYKNNISELGLVYIRPKSKDNGCKEDLISAEKIKFFKDKIIQNLKETIIDKILNTEEFQKNKGFFCNNCAYKFLCDMEDNDE